MDIEDTTVAEEARPAPQHQPKPQRPQRPPADRPDESFNEWVAALGASIRDYQVKIVRDDPVVADDGTPIAGHLATLDDFSEIDEDYIRQRWGGGKYTINVVTRNNQGKWVYAKRFPIRIGGTPPKYTGSKTEASPSTIVARDENPKLQEKAMDATMTLAKAERERADRLERELSEKAGAVPAWVSQLLGDARAREAALERRIEQLLEKANEKRPDDTPKYLELLIAQGGQQALQSAERHRAEIEAMQRNHEAQTRAMNDHHQRQLDSLRDEHKRALDGLQRANDMVVQTMTLTHKGQVDATAVAHQGQVNLLQTQLEGLKNELAETKRQLEKLRDEKKKGPTEMIEEIGRLKDGLEALGMAGGDEKDTWEKVVDKIGDVVNPFAKALAGGGARPPMPMPTEMMVPQGPPPGVPAGPPPVEPPPGFDPQDIPKLVMFVESAIANQQKPDVFARAVASTVPGYLVDAFRSDPEAFANEVSRVAPSSIIGSPRGRLFLRKVAQHLSGGEKPEVAA